MKLTNFVLLFTIIFISFNLIECTPKRKRKMGKGKRQSSEQENEPVFPESTPLVFPDDSMLLFK